MYWITKLPAVLVADSLHIACAVKMGCDYLFTVDDGMLARHIDEISILNPLEFGTKELKR
jgi:predicted nucleic acid-binding protein